MKIRKGYCAALLVCVVAALPIVAYPAESGNASQEVQKHAAIKRLMAVTGAQANQRELADNFTQQMISVLRANEAILTEHAISIIGNEVTAVVKEQLDDEVLQEKMYRIYAQYFTLEELEGLITFNESPIGKKANRIMPVLMRESMTAAQQWSTEIGPLLTRRVLQKLRESDVDLGKLK